MSTKRLDVGGLVAQHAGCSRLRSSREAADLQAPADKLTTLSSLCDSLDLRKESPRTDKIPPRPANLHFPTSPRCVRLIGMQTHWTYKLRANAQVRSVPAEPTRYGKSSK